MLYSMWNKLTKIHYVAAIKPKLQQTLMFSDYYFTLLYIFIWQSTLKIMLI